MKTYEQLTKKQLIAFIVKIRPKADAYDRVCEQLGIKNNILSYIEKLKKSKKKQLKYDVYEGKSSVTVIEHGKKDDDCIKFLRTIVGKDHNDCMKKHYKLMGWKPYKPF